MTSPTLPFASASAATIPKRKSTTSAERVVSQVRRLREMSPLYEMHQEGIDLQSIPWAAH